MERNDKIRGNRNLNWWERISELMEAGDQFRGKEYRICSLRRHSAVQQPLQRAASAIAAHYIRPRSTLASSITPSANGPTVHSHHHYTSSYYEREADKYPRESSLHKCQKRLLPQKPVGPMFCDANIGPTGCIVRIQLRLRYFGFPVCFCFHLHRKWQALKSGSLSASDG